MDPAYAARVSRNAGLVPEGVQDALSTLRIAVAGCGMGSALAEALVRIGVRHLRLIDADAVEVHNLNRQDFTAADVGRAKVDALRDRLLAIDPALEVDARCAMALPDTADGLLAGCDWVVDTIDFISLDGVVALHDAARRRGLPVLSALNIGFGGGIIHFPPRSPCTVRRLFGLPPDGPVDGHSYARSYAGLVRRIGAHLDPQVAGILWHVLAGMEEGRPCPAPQVVAGSWSMAAMTVSALVRILAGAPYPDAPHLQLLSLGDRPGVQSIDLMAGTRDA